MTVRRTALTATTSLLLAVTGCSDLPSRPVPLPEIPQLGDPVPLPAEPERYFDFWLGEWSVLNRKLDRRGNWRDAGDAVARIQPVAGGAAVLEQWTGTVDDERSNHMLAERERAGVDAPTAAERPVAVGRPGDAVRKIAFLGIAGTGAQGNGDTLGKRGSIGR